MLLLLLLLLPLVQLALPAAAGNLDQLQLVVSPQSHMLQLWKQLLVLPLLLRVMLYCLVLLLAVLLLLLLPPQNLKLLHQLLDIRLQKVPHATTAAAAPATAAAHCSVLSHSLQVLQHQTWRRPAALLLPAGQSLLAVRNLAQQLRQLVLLRQLLWLLLLQESQALLMMAAAVAAAAAAAVGASSPWPAKAAAPPACHAPHQLAWSAAAAAAECLDHPTAECLDHPTARAVPQLPCALPHGQQHHFHHPPLVSACTAAAAPGLACAVPLPAPAAVAAAAVPAAAAASALQRWPAAVGCCP
jgi:hypothetical protein